MSHKLGNFSETRKSVQKRTRNWMVNGWWLSRGICPGCSSRSVNRFSSSKRSATHSPRAIARKTRQARVFEPILPMELDMQSRAILHFFREGRIFREVASIFRISREVITGRMKRNPEFANAVKQAREEGKSARDFWIWVRHSRRGMRPPFGKGHGGKPRFSIKRRG